MSMVLKYLDAKGINGVNDYINLLNKRGSNGSRDAHLQSIKTLGYTATFNQSVDSEDIKDNIKRGLPVIAFFLLDTYPCQAGVLAFYQH